MRHLEFRVTLQRDKISMNEMRTALWKVQSSYLKETDTDKKYRLPSNMNRVANKLYQVMGIKRVQTVQKL